MGNYGIKVKNRTAGYQIDGEHKNYLYDEGKDNVALGLVYPNTYFALDYPCDDPPLVLIRPTGSFGFLGCSYNATTKKFDGFYAYGTGSMDYRVYKTGVIDSTENDKYGLRIYNNKREKVFSTLHSPFSILEVKTCSIGNTYTHSQISNPFYLMYPRQVKIETIERQPTPPYLYILRGSGSVVTRQSATSFSLDWLVQVPEYFNAGAINVNTGSSGIITICDPGLTLSA